MRSAPLFAITLAATLLAACAGNNRQVKEIDRNQLRKGYSELDREAGFRSAPPPGNEKGEMPPGGPGGNATPNGAAPQSPSSGDSYEAQYAAIKERNPTEVAQSPLPCIMVLPAAPANGKAELELVQEDPLARTAMGTINAYLTQKHYEVKSLEAQNQIDAVLQMQGEIFDQTTDLSYIASLSLGADIYIKFSYGIEAREVTAALNAYETSTGRLLATQSTEVNDYGRNTDQALVQSAISKALPGLERKFLAYWREDTQNGLQYKLIIRLEGDFPETRMDDIQSQVTTFLKKSFTNVRINVITDKTIDVTLYADSRRWKDSQEVYDFIRSGLEENFLVKKKNLTHKLILMELR